MLDGFNAMFSFMLKVFVILNDIHQKFTLVVSVEIFQDQLELRQVDGRRVGRSRRRLSRLFRVRHWSSEAMDEPQCRYTDLQF